MTTTGHDRNRSAVSQLVRSATIELIPLRSIEAQLELVPTGTTVAITCSSKLGLERTLEYTARAVKDGYQVVPHLAARQVTGLAELADFVARIDELGVTDLYVVGGDAEQVGIYGSAAEVLEDLQSLDHGLQRIGVACYPEGHPDIPDSDLLEALLRKQAHAHYMVSQLCFDPEALTSWLRRIRGAGVGLPLRVGLAPPLKVRKLMELSVRIGVGSSIRYLTKQNGMLSRLLPGSAYRPEKLLAGIDDSLSPDDASGIEGLHLFSFNQAATTVDWQRRIAGDPPAPGA